MWFTLALFVISFLVTAFLSPKPKLENARRQSLDATQFPHSNQGDPIPLVLGKVRLKGPNTLWYGDFTSKAIKKTVKTGMFSSKKVTVGYHYFIGLAMGLCVGPGVRLRRIWFDKDQVWSGDIGGEASSTIDLPGLWGGDNNGGGWSGGFVFYEGSFNQTVNSYLELHAGADHSPAYQGISLIVFQHNYIGTQPTLRSMSFELERYTTGLGLTSLVNVIGEDLNPMEVIYQILTSNWGGLNVDPLDLDIPTFQAVANVLAAEANGCSLLVTTTNNGQDLIEEVLRQINGVLYQDPSTGKIVPKLIRDDYVIEDLPVFDESNVLDIKSYSRTLWNDTVNQFRVNYYDRSNKYEIGTAIAQDMANINAQGRLRANSEEMPLCYVSALANQIATRELNQLNAPILKVTLEVNRTAWNIRPGFPFVWKWAAYRIEQTVMRVQRVVLGELINGTITIDAIQDQFGIKNTIFANPLPTLYTPTDRSAHDVTDYAFTELPYWLVYQATDIILLPEDTPPDYTYMMLLARRPNSYQQGFTVTMQQGLGPDVVVEDHVDFTDTAKLFTPITRLTGYANGLITTLVVSAPLDDSTIFEARSTAETRVGHNLFLLGTELMSYETVHDNGDSTWNLGNVRRALLDTEMVDHAAGETLFIMSADYFGSPIWVADTLINAYVQSFTDRDETDFASAPHFTTTPRRRLERPVAPDYLTLNGSRSPATITSTAPQTLAWRARTRTRTDIAFEDDVADTAETGTTYTVRFYLDGTLDNTYTQTGISASSTTISFGPITGNGRLEVVAVLGGLESYLPNFIEFAIHTGGFLLLSGDMTSGSDATLLSGDMTDGDDHEDLSGAP